MPESYKKRIEQLTSEYNLAQQQVSKEQQALTDILQKEEDSLLAQKLVQGVARATQEHVHKQIASVITRCLQAVFAEEAYDFQLRFHEKRGKTEVSFVFSRDGQEITDPLNAVGGGVIDVVAFALRLTSLMLARPKKRRVLLLDEPFRCVSKNYRPAIKELLLTLAHEMKVQIVQVTHAPELAVGKVISL